MKKTKYFLPDNSIYIYKDDDHGEQGNGGGLGGLAEEHHHTKLLVSWSKALLLSITNAGAFLHTTCTIFAVYTWRVTDRNVRLLVISFSFSLIVVEGRIHNQ